MSDQTKETPKFPYVEFRRIEKDTHPQTKESIEHVSTYFLDVRGVHGRPESITEHLKRGHQIVSYGNLNSNHDQIGLTGFLRGLTGDFVDPRIAEAIANDPMTKKIKAAK